MTGFWTLMRRIGASWTFGAIAAIATLILMTILSSHADCNGTSVQNLPLQMAWTAATASAIVQGWHGCEAQAVNQVLLDYPFIVAYVALFVFFGLRSRRAAERRGMSGLACAAGASAWGALVAGVCDCLEDIGLIIMIGWDNPPPIVPLLTSLFSSAKWLLIASNLLVTITTIAAVFIHRRVCRVARA